ncbi:endonuclease/exonuclease/phosphatase family protein [Xanthobacter flavus]|uniref:endonuclease/exonuclease/phosphatase family protein n=1 Tax=Xanthobacter flavus TaxID=281 RepID=UPI003727C77C
MQTIKVILWNVQWQRAATAGGNAVRQLIAAHDPDLICLTEAGVDLVDGAGRVISEADFGGTVREDRRKVVIWSRWPWREDDDVGDPSLPPGRFARGSTQTPHGMIDLIGVCIPWDGAHVKMGRKDCKPWEEHARYLDGLERILSRSADHSRTIILGDFNQAIPRTRAPQAVHDQLQGLLKPHFDVATAGPIEGLRFPAIDHLAHGAAFSTTSVSPLPNETSEDRRISDHVGLLITLSVSG